MKLNNRNERTIIIPGHPVKNLAAGSLPEEEEIVEEAVIPEEVLILEEEEVDLNNESLERWMGPYSLTWLMELELNIIQVSNTPQRYTINSQMYKRKC